MAPQRLGKNRRAATISASAAAGWRPKGMLTGWSDCSGAARVDFFLSQSANPTGPRPRLAIRPPATARWPSRSAARSQRRRAACPTTAPPGVPRRPGTAPRPGPRRPGWPAVHPRRTRVLRGAGWHRPRAGTAPGRRNPPGGG
jgi:hypothetical protein